MLSRRAIIAIFAVGAAATALLSAGAVRAQDMQKVKAAMALLKAQAEKLGPAKIEGADTVAGKTVPALFFGATKMNNNFALVEEVAKQAGGTATIFVKSGDDYVRIATNVKKDDGSRAIGTVLDPKGKAIESINRNEAFYGEVAILGKPYITGYESMHDAAGAVIGIYYVGYMKENSAPPPPSCSMRPFRRHMARTAPIL